MRRTWILLVACLGLVLAACGDDGGTGDGGAATTTTAAAGTTDGAGGADTDGDGAEPAEAPQRIVSLSPTATEVLFAIGAGDQVVAVDSLSDHPAEAPVTELSAYEPNLEAIAAYDPDLVIIAGYDPGDLVSGLEGIGIPVVSQGPARDLDEVYAQIEELGTVTGRVDEAATVVAEVRSRIEAAVAAAGDPAEPVAVYHEVDDTFYSAASSSFTGQLYALLGFDNIADEADDGSGYPQLNPEYILEADPDLIVITDEVGYGPAEVGARPGWGAITAVANGDVLQVDADLPSRWGPRVADFVELMADHLAEMRTG
jgi:iron complex transport system substrate-binding protein